MTRKDRKNYLPAILLSLFWWVVLGLIVAFVDPKVLADYPIAGSYGLFFLLLFLACWFSLGLIFRSGRRGLLLSIAVVVAGYLQLLGLLNVINGLLLIGTLIGVEIYLMPSTPTLVDKE